MPGLDKTGPDGQGSKTGRRLGRCNPDFKEESFADNANNAGLASRLRLGYGRNAGKFFGRGRGRNRGWGSERSPRG